MSEEDPTKCPPSHRWSSCHPPTSDGSVCLATGKCPVCPVTFRSLSAITRMSSDEFQMKMSYQCPTSVLLLSDHLPVAPITLLLVTYQHHLCVTNWNVSDQYPTKLVGSEKSAFRPASGQPPASVGQTSIFSHRHKLGNLGVCWEKYNPILPLRHKVLHIICVYFHGTYNNGICWKCCCDL